jgi:hypothetical protein
LPVFGSPVRQVLEGAGVGGLYDILVVAVGAGLAILLVIGLCRGDERSSGLRRFLWLYLLIYGGVLLNFSGYPTGVQLRLLLPVLPILLWGLGGSFARIPDRGRRLVVPVLVAVLAMGLFHNGYRIARPLRSTDGPGGRALYDPGVGAVWIRANTAPDDVIMVRLPLKQHIHFQRPVVGYGEIEAGALEKTLAESGAAWIVVGPHPQVPPDEPDTEIAALREYLRSRPDRFEPAYREPSSTVSVYRVLPFAR